MARKKKAWGPSNPLWRWQHGKKKTGKKRRSNPGRKTRRSTHMARRRSRGRRGGMKIPVIPLAIVAGQVLSAHAEGGTLGDKAMRMVAMYTGFEIWSNSFRPDIWLLKGVGPWVGYGLVKRFVYPFVGNPNRYLARAKLPISL